VERNAEHVQRVAGVFLEGEARQGEAGNVASVHTTRQPFGVDQDVQSEEDQAERSDPQIDAAKPGGDRAEQQAGQASDSDCQDGSHQRRQPEAEMIVARCMRVRGKVGVTVGADGDEEGMAEGEHAGLTEQQGETKGRDGRGEPEEPELEPERVEVEGHDQ
jgi:hypothetical protein